VTDATGISYSEAHHHMGTTRMSEQPKTGVVDANCKVHGVDNLYIAGSSVFPTSGYANPTWTIIALALRLSDHLKETSEGLP
jgi:choline dehydrogenase-like flavoprotein